MARLLRLHRGAKRPRPRPVPAHEAARTGASFPDRLPGDGLDAVREHHPGRPRAVVPRRRAPRAPHSRLYPLERRGHGDASELEGPRHRRSPVDLRRLGRAVRGRLQPLLPRQGKRPRRRPGLLPRPWLARHLRPRLRRGAPRRGVARQLPFRDRRPRLVELPAPAPHAGLLGVPHRVDGPRPAGGGVPGAFQPVSPPPRDRRHLCFAGVVLRRRRRDGRAREPRRPSPCRPREARQPRVRRQLQPAAPRRARPGQRQDHPGAGGALPRLRLERHQGHLGPSLGRAATSTGFSATR